LPFTDPKPLQLNGPQIETIPSWPDCRAAFRLNNKQTSAPDWRQVQVAECRTDHEFPHPKIFQSSMIQAFGKLAGSDHSEQMYPVAPWQSSTLAWQHHPGFLPS
jgi:hypothetical protein